MRFRVFFCTWTRTLWVFPGSQTSSFGFSRADLWVQTAFGSLRGASVSQNSSRTTRLCAFFCVSVLSNVHCALPFFSNMLRKPLVFAHFLLFCSNMHCALPCFFEHVAKTTRFRIFLEPRGRVPCLLFRRFRLLAL